MFVGIFLRMFCESYAKERAQEYIYIHIFIHTNKPNIISNHPFLKVFFQAMTVSLQEALLPHMGPAKDKHGVRESLDS